MLIKKLRSYSNFIRGNQRIYGCHQCSRSFARYADMDLDRRYLELLAEETIYILILFHYKNIEMDTALSG